MLRKIRKEIKNRKHCETKFEKLKYFVKRQNTKISLIITIYNQKNFLIHSYFYILKQKMQDIEIIFIFDSSTDGSSKIIKNKTNKGTFFSRNERMKVLFYLKEDISLLLIKMNNY